MIQKSRLQQYKDKINKVFMIVIVFNKNRKCAKMKRKKQTNEGSTF